MNELQLDGRIEAFDEEKREVQVFVLPWDRDAEKADGLHQFKRGGFAGVDPGRFVLRQRHQDPPTGKGFDLREEDDGLRMWFKVSKTAAGNEQLELIKDGVETGISVGFGKGVESKKTRLTDGRYRYTYTDFSKADQLEVSTTWKPAFKESQVLQVLEADTVAEAAPQEEAPKPQEMEVTPEMVKAFEAEVMPALQARFDALQDRITALGLKTPDSLKAEAERQVKFIDEVGIEAFAIDDVISSDNTGVIPLAYVNRIIGVIDSSRPFLEATTRLPTPPAGETLRLPKITQRPEVGKQATEKSEVASQKTIITSVDFGMETYAGAGDLSIQLIKRSSPDFLNLWTQLLGEQYAIVTDNAAVDALLAQAAVVEGGSFDPSSPSFGGAFANAAAAAGGRPALLPNRIFMNTAALVAFIDAKEPSGGGGRPLYPGLAQIAGMAGGAGTGPAGFTLQPVWVPALDDEAVDLIVGPSSGFLWTEDGTYTLTADVPDKAGRDVGIVGMIWFAPVYPAAYTSYTLAS